MNLKKIFLGTMAGMLLCTNIPVTAFAKKAEVAVYDVETGKEKIRSFDYDDSDKAEELPPSDGEVTEAGGKVFFYDGDGSVRTLTADKSGRVRIPTSRNLDGYTFLGWSEVFGQGKNPKYIPGQVMKVKKKAVHLYAVMYNWNEEPDVQVGNLAGNLSKYSKIIFVGDSRTNYLRKTLLQEYGENALSKVKFISKPGRGLDWFKEEGEARLRKELSITTVLERDEPTAVIFNLGVNDLIHRGTLDYKGVTREYLSYMNALGRELGNQNCRLFYMSVNPVNTAMKPTRRESELLYFNAQLKKGLSENFGWIDTYNYLMKNGYSTYNAFRGNLDDGVHYSGKTYKRIYKYCMKSI